MHRHNTGSGEAPAGAYHRMGSPPPNQGGPSGITSPEPHPQSPPGFSTHTHPLQQFLMGTPLQGININLRGQPVLHTRIGPAAVAPGVVPIQTGPTEMLGYQQQLSPQAMVRQLHPSTQAFLQMSGLQGQAITTSGVNLPQQRSVLNVPLSPGRSFVDPATGMPIHQVDISPSSSVQPSNNPFVFQDVHKTFPESGGSHISQESLIVQNLLMPSQQPMGTIHHLGQGSPGRASMPPLSSPSRVSGSPRRSSSHSPTRGSPGHKSPTGGGYRRPHSPARTSPLPSSPSLVMRKTMMPQTEERPPANAEVAELRRQVLQERLTDLKRLKETYNDKQTELFFLQNSGNMMDFLSWKKRPNQQLFVYLARQRMDDEEEKTINDEVKVITNSGSNIPVGTPVAISTQLPPAVSALSSQLNQKAREQKAREMTRSLPGSIQAAAAAAAGSAGSLGDGEASRKRTFSQAGLESVGGAGQDKKVQLMHSSHEPNVTVTPSMMTAIPSLPGAGDALGKQQQSQQPGQQHSSKLHEPSTPSRLQTVARNTQPAKSPPGKPANSTHSLHQLKFPSPSSVGSTPTSSSTQGTPAPRKTPTMIGPPTPGVSSATPSPGRTPKQTPLSPAQQRLATRQQSLSAVYDYTIGSQEMIVEKAKQEAQVMQRIAELRKEGLWAAKRLPKVQEVPRHKTHWDYLLEEMQWLATDFAQERRWKRASARKLVRAVARHHQDLHAREIKAEKEESQKLKKIAGNMAKEIMTFWANIEKVVQYKQQSRLEERRKKVMDLQLDYIVGQTEKYSSWLTEGLNLPTSSTTTSVQGSVTSSPRSEGSADAITGDDVDFQPVGDDSDDEETIDVEEEAAEDDADAHAKEIELLQRESELPLEDLLSSLPPGMLDKPGSSSEGGEKRKEDDKSTGKKMEDREETSLKTVTEEVKDDGDSKQDEEFVLSADEDQGAGDEEETLEEQEATEGTLDHKAEIAELEADGDLPIEELMKRYAGAYEDEYEYPRSEESDVEETEDDSVTEESEEEQGTDEEEEELADIGMEYLIHPEKVAEEPKPSKQTGKGEPNKEITDIAAAAQSLQPTGYTLSTTQVKTKVPHLLRHKLREYQHIGLDWMVTLHEKKLNGILADEMGLGKTIQTIALLAHLACEEENWGPHLIVVPTSVMLNWEMELKKWCPGFKILTYFGNQKERKLKRQGWTKCNAFHVCITSYKLVIQDHQSFRRKKWKYLVLDEAQNIKNFKSQRWQTLLNFNSQRRLLLTGTPLQNNLMELWSLMHFLMPHVFASHREFREWFSNPLSGMIEGTQEYNEGLIRRLHKVLRPFLLRRLKSEVEKQLPQKYEHVVKCRLSKRQRFLYEDFMSRARTRETLASGHFMSVINVLMQLRKVCNHPDLFEARPISSPFQMEGIHFYTASLALRALEHDPFKHIDLGAFNLCIADLEKFLPAYAAHRTRKLQTPRKLIEEIDSSADIPPRLPKLKVKPGKLFTPVPAAVQAQPKEGRASPLILSSGRASPMQQGSASPVLIRTQTQGAGGRSSPVVTQFLVRSPSGTQLLRQTPTPPGTPASAPGITTLQLTGTSTPGTFTLVSTQSPVVPGATPLQQLPGYTGTAATSTTTTTASLASIMQQRLVLQQQIGAVSGSTNRAQFVTSQPITLQLQQNRGQQGARIAIPASQLQLQSQGGLLGTGGIVRIVQTPSGQQIVRQAPQSSVISQQTLLQQQQLLQQRQQQQRQQQQIALQSVAGGQQVTVNSQQLVNSIVNQVRTQAAAQPTQTNQVAAAAAPQLARIQQQPQLSAVAQVQNALQQQQQQQFLQQLQQQQQQLKLQQTVQTTTAQSQPQVVSVSSGLAQNATSSTVVAATSSATSSANQTESKPAQSIPKLQTVQLMRVTGSSASIPTPTTSPSTTINNNTTTTTIPATRPQVPSPGPSTPTTPQRDSAKMSIGSPMQPVVKITPLSSVSVAALSAGTMSVKVATSSGAKTTTTPSKTYSTAAARKAKREAAKKSPFYLESIEHKRDNDRKATLQRIATINKMRCSAKPVYGQDLFSAVSIYNGSPPAGGSNPLGSGIGHVFSQCVRVLGDGKGQCQYTDALRRLIRSPEDMLVELEEIIKRYAIVVPLAEAPPISMHTSHPPPSFLTDSEYLANTVSKEMKPRMSCLHELRKASKFQFPELRLIQYDCGKLQAMDVLLRQLKLGSHRALIFTQMTKMLDVLERFLNYYGYIYLRLDGATRVEQRQVLMERFNADPRIFCFILSTRSGGVGVNLTGADTVIFYDSDWNPTMDAQAQDRCHRIGQTRDVHIYRLVSEMTVEENILKKANQKRLLVDVSIEGGNFTTAFFRERTIKDLFDMSTAGNMAHATELVVEDLKAKGTPVATPPQGDAAAAENLTKEQLEQALARTEDETDVQAASKAHAEQDAELAEFDEDIPYEGEEGKNKDEPSKVEIELAQLDDQLTPIEKYAMNFLECTLDSVALEELQEAEEQIEEAKKEWELGRLKAIKEEEERRAEMEEDEILFTYARDDAENKIYISQTDEIMPMWAPPTPPQDDNDVYIDHSMGLLYDASSMMESQLPPVYIKKEPKKIKVDHVRKLKPHLPKGDAQSHTPHTIAPPQSLFNRPSAALLRMRREAKQQKLRAMAGKQVVKPQPIVHRPSTAVEAHSADRPEWLINEDWALLQAVQALQELPLTLQAVVPGHVINWDLVSDVVNACGHTYRSPKQCRSRYEGVIIPREEGKILYDTNPKKQKKSKGIYRTKSNRPMKTSQLHAQDGNSAHTQLFNSKFDLIKAAVSKKQPYLKQVLNNPLLKNPKHSAVLNDFGIGYEKPMSPVQVAAKRAERIAREKKAQQEQQQQRLQAAAAAKQQQQAAAIAQAVATATTASVMTTGPSNRTTTLGPGSLTLTRTTNSATSGLVITTPRIVSTAVRAKDLKQSGPITRTTLGPGTTPIRTVNSAASSIVVNTPPGAVSTVTGHTFASINKRMNQGIASIATVAGATPTVASTLAQVVRAQAGTRTSVVTLPSTAGIITSQVRGVTTATVVMTTSASAVARPTATLTGAQLTVASMKNLTQLTPAQISQLALFKQQALRQQQLQQQQQSSQLKQQLKQSDIKRLQQAQAQAQAAQVQAQAQAQAAQQQVTAQALQGVQKTGVTATVVGTTAATVVSAAQAQLIAARQQQVAKLQQQQRVAQAKLKGTGTTLPVSGVRVSTVPMQVKAVQQKQTTLARPTTLKESDVAALIKLQQQRLAQAKLKGTVTTLPVSGVKISSVPMQVKGVVTSAGQKAGQATAMKALTIQPGGKLSLQQIIQMQQAQKVQQQAAQQKLLGVKAQLLQKQVQQVVTSGGTIRVSSPVVVTSSLSGQQMIQSSAVQAGTVHHVQSAAEQSDTSQYKLVLKGLQVSQAQLAQGVRLQQVTSAQGTPTVQVQRVTQVPQSQMTTVRQQLGLQQQVKQAAAAQGTTLSIQQAVKPVTLIQTGASLLPGTKTATVSQAQLLQKQMLAQIVTSAAAAQQSTPTNTVSVAQLARVVAPPTTVQAVPQVSQPQQTLTVESVAIAQPVQQKQEEVKETVPSLTTTVKPAVGQPVIAAQSPQAQVSVTAQPPQPQQQATAQPIRTVTAAQLQQAQAALRQQQQQQQAAEAQNQQGSSQRTSPYAMRLRKPSQTNN